MTYEIDVRHKGQLLFTVRATVSKDFAPALSGVAEAYARLHREYPDIPSTDVEILVRRPN
jgi:hypothetical protein